MKKNSRMILVIMFLGLAMLACNLSFQRATQTPVEPTPNQTMTALFSIVTQQQPTLAPPVASATQDLAPVASATSAPPTEASATAQSATSVPTTTSTAAPTAEIRPAGKASATYLATAPSLDGVWDEWSTTAYPARFVVYGSTNRTDKEDLEGSYRIGWDNTYLYLAVKVIDDKYVQNATGIDIFKGDSIELLLDTDLTGDQYSTSITSDDYQLVISPGKPDTAGTKEAYMYYPSSVAGSRPQVKISSAGGDGTYRVELAIPWSLFGITPATGQRYGFAVSVSDNDNSSANEQQSMVSNVSNRALTDPTTWALLTLVK
jgi:hypothetical protein